MTAATLAPPKRSVLTSGLAAIREEMERNRRLQAERRAVVEADKRAAWSAKSAARASNSGGYGGGAGGSFEQRAQASVKGGDGSSPQRLKSSSRVGSFSSAFGTAGRNRVASAIKFPELPAKAEAGRAPRRIMNERQLFQPKLSARAQEARNRAARAGRTISITDDMTVRELASALGYSRDRIFSALRDAGEPAKKPTDVVDGDIAELIASEAGAKVRRVVDPRRDRVRTKPPPMAELAAIDAPLRAPVVAVMGHVDHGKTSLLDALRGAAVAAREAGGITQGLSAFSVAMRAAAQATGMVRAPGGKAAKKGGKTPGTADFEESASGATSSLTARDDDDGGGAITLGRVRRTSAAIKAAAARAAAKASAKKAAANKARAEALAAAESARAAGLAPIAFTDIMTFIDTPGHALFASMRAQGSAITDVVVLVVDGGAGVQPQTKECIALILESQVACVVAVTKCDVNDSSAAVMRVAKALAIEGLLTEADGGETPIVAVSARSGLGLEDLKASIALQAEAAGLRARTDAPGEAAVLDSRVATGLGQVVDAIVTWGTLRVGDIIVAGTEVGRIRALFTDAVAAASLTRRLAGASGSTSKASSKASPDKAEAFKPTPVREALPGTPVRVVGLRGAPAEGDALLVVESEERGKAIVEGRKRRAEVSAAASIAAANALQRASAKAEYKRRQARRVALKLAMVRERKRAALRRAGQPIPDRMQPAPWETAIIEEARAGEVTGVSSSGRAQRVQGGQQLDDALPFALAAAAAEGGDTALATARAVPVVALVLRADSAGALSVLSAAVARIPMADARVTPRIVSATVGDFTEKDVAYAAEFKATLIGFGARAPSAVSKAAERVGVVLKTETVIYRVLDFLLLHLADALPVEDVEGVVATAEVKTVFTLRGKGDETAAVIAGCAVIEGELKTGAAKYRVIREGEVLHESSALSSLQHLKDRVTSVAKGKECGVGLAAWTDYKAGDRIVAIGITKKKQVISVKWA